MLLANPKTGGETEKLDYQAQKNSPENPKKNKEEEEEPEENLQKQIADLAKTERETADELEGKSGGASSTSQPPEERRKGSCHSKPAAEEQIFQGGEQAQKGEQGQKGEQPPSDQAKLAERQQQAALKAAEIAKKMQDDEAMTELAQDRIANAERAIRASAKSLEGGNKTDAGRKAKEAAAQLERLAQQVGG